MSRLARFTRLKFRRLVRRQSKSLEVVKEETSRRMERVLSRRIQSAKTSRRFVLSWTILFILLIGLSVAQTRSLEPLYMTNVPDGGGVFREGMVGAYTNANPLFAVSSADLSVSKLVFSGLFVVDENSKMRPALAQSFSVNPEGTVYTVVLKSNAKWHDGLRVTAKDVVYTYKMLQNPDVTSPFFANWSGVVVEQVDELTVKFILPNALASFQYSLTNGIVPVHLLESVLPRNLRTTPFNTKPIGSGPFVFRDVEAFGTNTVDRIQSVVLEKNKNYFDSQPYLDGFIVTAYGSQPKMMADFDEKKLNSVVSPLRDDLYREQQSTVRLEHSTLVSGVGMFINTSRDNVKDQKLRQALIKGINTSLLARDINPVVKRLYQPILNSHSTYASEFNQFGYNKAEAEQLLESSGWLKVPQSNYREKAGKSLDIRFVTTENADYKVVAEAAKKAWQDIGVRVDVEYIPEAVFEERVLSSASAASRDYDVLLYGIDVGYDPDIFAYWHSSQSDVRSASRLNLSDYKSAVSDAALESGRTRLDPQLRAVKYKPFYSAWKQDVPAIMLYQPNFTYLVQSETTAPLPLQMRESSDHYYFVNQWSTKTKSVLKRHAL
jgi:peptide/nickel transport system substrate-binding protein